jgi:hypothetical protein
MELNTRVFINFTIMALVGLLFNFRNSYQKTWLLTRLLFLDFRDLETIVK